MYTEPKLPSVGKKMSMEFKAVDYWLSQVNFVSETWKYDQKIELHFYYKKLKSTTAKQLPFLLHKTISEFLTPLRQLHKKIKILQFK